MYNTKHYRGSFLEKIITIHGFLGSPWNMYYHSHYLKQAGFSVNHWGYPSRDKTIQEHGADLATYLQKEAQKNPGKPLNFLTHSMGGLVLRSALNHPACPEEAKIGKAILLAPPNHGSQSGREIGKNRFVKFVIKEKAGKELTHEKDFAYLGEFPPSLKALVITGKADGLVSMDETKLNSSHRLEMIKGKHMNILFNSEAFSLIKSFFSLS